ncbi:MAG: hypothetical protein ACODAE_08155 [Gemmatimonadota bacterium]
MRKMSWLLPALMAFPVLAGCAGSDGSPVAAAKTFHERLLARDDAGAHALLTEADRGAVPLAAFPDSLPDGIAMTLFAWSEAPLDSAALLRSDGDTAAVVLYLAERRPDTLRLVATNDPIGVAGYELDRVRWRVAAGIAERMLLDSLAAAMRTRAEASSTAGVEEATAYVEAAERHPARASPADLDAARRLVRRAAVARELRVELRVTETFTGSTVIDGRIENPTRHRIGTLRLIVRDDAGGDDSIVVWGIDPDAAVPIQQVTGLDVGRPTHRVEEIQVY